MKLTRIFNGRAGSRRACLGLLFALAACAAAAGQTAPRVFIETSFPMNQLVKLVGAEVAGGMHDFALEKSGYHTASFDATAGWLRGLTLKIRNKSDKTILSATFNGSLAVGEAGLTFTDEELHNFRSFAERLNGSVDFQRLRLGRVSVKFADGTRASILNPARTVNPPAVKSN